MPQVRCRAMTTLGARPLPSPNPCPTLRSRILSHVERKRAGHRRRAINESHSRDPALSPPWTPATGSAARVDPMANEFLLEIFFGLCWPS
jgi:hypothetical protein